MGLCWSCLYEVTGSAVWACCCSVAGSNAQPAVYVTVYVLNFTMRKRQ